VIGRFFSFATRRSGATKFPMEKNYCTLFDKNYLLQAMALLLSLKRVAGSFRLYVLCMDDEAYRFLQRLSKTEPVTPVHERELRIARKQLEEHKQRTTHGQYCWSCQPFSIDYLLERFSLDSLTYLEADSMFFSNPQVLFDEIGQASVSLVPHNFAPGFDQTASSGRFCVQFNFFRNDDAGRKVLAFWEQSCLAYNRDKPLSYPGQVTLDEWPEKFGHAVKVIQNQGAGVAPWNLQKFDLDSDASGCPTVNNIPVVFFHYHEFGFLEEGKVDLSSYPLPPKSVALFYRPYLESLKAAEALIKNLEPVFSNKKFKKRRAPWREFLHRARRRVQGTYNIYDPTAILL
jgi:hypothetical protein